MLICLQDYPHFLPSPPLLLFLYLCPCFDSLLTQPLFLLIHSLTQFTPLFLRKDGGGEKETKKQYCCDLFLQVNFSQAAINPF